MVGAARSMVGQRAALAVKVVSYARNDSEGRYRKMFAPPPICTTLCLQRLRSNLQELAHTWGLCPFHDEKTPSFSVRPALGVWHCFGCGLGGDVFGYVEHQENVDFRDAVELLADRYHIELRYDQSNAKKEHTGSKRARLLEANEAAQVVFRLAADDQRRARRAQTA